LTAFLAASAAVGGRRMASSPMKKSVAMGPHRFNSTRAVMGPHRFNATPFYPPRATNVVTMGPHKFNASMVKMGPHVFSLKPNYVRVNEKGKVERLKNDTMRGLRRLGLILTFRK
jgi:hypothetical protein